ncbi:MAG: hypothetical protein COC01_02790 [Bacteroidetes bacterium]|nr:MAG: hypothetical protein COC01_02790 [Bacteroidota bacterium]
MKTIQDVLNWFGDRGVDLTESEIKKWHWDGKYLFYIIKINPEEYECRYGADIMQSTEEGKVQFTHTHRDDGSPILFWEIVDDIPYEKSPFKDDKAIAK